jgi:phosphatidylinositol-3-phosphatase
MTRIGRLVAGAAAMVLLGATSTIAVAVSAAAGLPRPDHVVIVMLENKRYDKIVGDPKTPWITGLSKRSANFTQFYGETHPSQPNYLALFSGSTQDVADNNCPHDLGARPNLARQLMDAGHTFAGYAEGLPAVGWRGCAIGRYVRRHVPWVNFSNVPASVSQPFTAFPRDYRKLPTVAFVVPDLCHDMHDCPKVNGDAWLRRTFTPYVAWAQNHNSLLIITFDEDDKTDGNHIPAIIAGARVRAGQYPVRLNHYDLLGTLQQMYGLTPAGHSASPRVITGVWS